MKDTNLQKLKMKVSFDVDSDNVLYVSSTCAFTIFRREYANFTASEQVAPPHDLKLCPDSKINLRFLFKTRNNNPPKSFDFCMKWL